MHVDSFDEYDERNIFQMVLSVFWRVVEDSIESVDKPQLKSNKGER